MTAQNRLEVYAEDHGQRTQRVTTEAPNQVSRIKAKNKKNEKKKRIKSKCWNVCDGCLSYVQLCDRG